MMPALPGNVLLTFAKTFIMNSKFIASALIAAASLASMSAFAAGADNAQEPQRPFVSSKSRAEVRADALTVKKGPVTASSQVDGGMTAAATPAASQSKRDEVRAEAVQTRANFQALDNTAPGRA